MDNYQSPSPCNLGRETIFAIGELVANDLGYLPGESLDPIVSKIGGTISYFNLLELDQLGAGSINIEDAGKFEILLATHTSEVRDRFTICHELGHYYLHYMYPNRDSKVVEKLKAARYGNTLAEYEANWFAASFLMPEKLFRTKFEESNGELSVLSSIFAVSLQAADVRAKSLGLY